MLCWNCNTGECYNFSHLCKPCRDAAIKHQKEVDERYALFEYKGQQYADNCATCHRKETTLWIVSFQAAPLGGVLQHGRTTGVWCDDCIAGMVGKPEITSGLTFTGVHDIRFLKKCYEPPIDKVAQEAIDILKTVDF